MTECKKLLWETQQSGACRNCCGLVCTEAVECLLAKWFSFQKLKSQYQSIEKWKPSEKYSDLGRCQSEQQTRSFGVRTLSLIPHRDQSTSTAGEQANKEQIKKSSQLRPQTSPTQHSILLVMCYSKQVYKVINNRFTKSSHPRQAMMRQNAG
jgi:hypothetical protein